MYFTTEDLVAAIKLSDHFPLGQNAFTDPDDFISLANEEMHLKLVAPIMGVRQDFFVALKTTPLVSGVSRYAIPERAIGNALKDLFYVPDLSDLSSKYPLPIVPIHDSQNYQNSGDAPAAFYMQSDEIVLVPTPTNPASNSGLGFYHFQRPSKLVPTSQCAKVTAISNAGGTVTLTVNTDLTTIPYAVADLVDVVSGRSPFRTRAIDVALTSVTSTQLQMASSSVTSEGQLSISVGDYICLAQTSCIPQVPQEFHPILSEMVCARINKAQGAAQNFQACMALIQDGLKSAFKLIANRVEGEVDTVMESNGIMSLVGGSSHRFVSR